VKTTTEQNKRLVIKGFDALFNKLILVDRHAPICSASRRGDYV
jgi:hypothetical protein